MIFHLSPCGERVGAKKKLALFSGTHTKGNGVRELITAWRMLHMLDWGLHITGYGDMTEELRRLAALCEGVVFHALVSRKELVSLMCSAAIGINPHELSQTPGNVFAFKIIEYLGAGAHVVTTRMGVLEPEIEAGIAYISDNTPDTIAAGLKRVIDDGHLKKTARSAALERYGSKAVSEGLDACLRDVTRKCRRPGR